MIQSLCKKHEMAIGFRQTWENTLQMFFQDPWFENLVEFQARQLAIKHPSPVYDWEDIRQETIVRFAEAIEKDPSLGCCFQRNAYGTFLSRVIANCSQKTIRRVLVKTPIRLDFNEQQIDNRSEIDDEIDTKELIAQLPKRSRSVLQLLAKGKSCSDIAKINDRTLRTIVRWRQEAINQIHELRNPKNDAEIDK